jgi:aminoglycoside phosphotransferase (APT) family kinase protein
LACSRLKRDGSLYDGGGVQSFFEHKEEEERHLATVFRHGDVSVFNIMVKGGKVAALIDFEMAGFYPEYWEYTTAMNSNYIKGWREGIAKFLMPHPRKSEMDDLWRKNFRDGP